MHKRVLLVEQSETVRGVAETVLRQNGYEVIPVASADKALEVLSFSRPELMILGTEVMFKGQRPFYERVTSDASTNSIPLLLIAPPGKTDLPFPEEVVMTMPFNPQEFLERVKIFAGQSSQPQAVATISENPLEGASVGDDFLDAALGIDNLENLEVTDSEVMDKTVMGKNSGKSESKSPTGTIHVDKTDTNINDSGRVESIMISDDQADIVQRKSQEKALVDLSGSQKLDILGDSDQYGIDEPDAFEASSEGHAHDYDWFVNEMQSDTKAPAGSSLPSPPRSDNTDDSGGIHVHDNSAIVEPVKAAGVKEVAPAPEQSEGVMKFIDEFKKEIEKFRDDEPESIMVEPDSKAKPDSSDDSPAASDWEESEEKVSPREASVFTRLFAKELAEKVASLIVGKIDQDKLMRLIAHEIKNRSCDDK